MATNNFLEFNTNKNNIQTDAEYSTETQRTNGVNGIANTKMHNKLFRQVSVMAAAIGEFIKGTGNDASDASVSALTDAISKSFATKASIDAKNTFEKAGGTATAITLSTASLIDGYGATFIASYTDTSTTKTINGKPWYKPGTTTAPATTSGRAYTIWYSVTGGCFFIKASAEGNSVAGDVLAGKTFSNDLDTGLTGTIPSKSAQIYTPGTTDQTIAASQYLSGPQTIKGDANLIPSNILSPASIFGVVGTAIAGKRWASGTTFTHIVDHSCYRADTGVLAASSAVQISTPLNFTPRFIFIIFKNSGYSNITIYDENSLSSNANHKITTAQIGVGFSVTGPSNAWKLDGAAAYVNSNGFVLPVIYDANTTTVYSWYAYE